MLTLIKGQMIHNFLQVEAWIKQKDFGILEIINIKVLMNLLWI